MQALRPKLWALLVLGLGGAGAFVATQGAPVEAADHLDPPNRVHSATPATDDRASDIADVFAWTRGAAGASQTTVLALTFDGPNTAAALTAVPCDRDVLYTIHITPDGGICPATAPGGGACGTPDATHLCGPMCTATFADSHTINVRFAHNGTGTACYVQAEFSAHAGAAAAISPTIAGPVDTNLVRGTTSFFAGLRDDAFFFDLQGFRTLLATGALGSLDHTRDFFTGMNTPAIVIEVPTSAITNPTGGLSTGAFRVWASTSRFHAS